MTRKIHKFAAATVAGVLLLFSADDAPAQQAKTEGSSGEAVLAYREAANFQNNGAFEVAAEEWQKFLKEYRKDPLAAKAQHYLGVCQLQLKQHEKAIASFETVLKNDPTFELAEEASFDLATCQYALAAGGQKEMYSQAAKSFTALLEKFPAGKYREDALFYQGESLYAQGKKTEAVTAYERLVAQFALSKRRADTLYALGVAQEELGNHAAAGKTYDALLREFPGAALVHEVRLRKAETMLQSGDIPGAERLFASASATKDFPAADHALSRQAYCLAKLDRFAEAAAAYAKLASNYPQSSYAADASISAGRCYYRANATQAARQWLEEALARRDMHSAEAAHWLCRLFIRAGETRAAAELAEREIGNAQGTFAANLVIDLADALYEMPARRSEALALYVKFSQKHPGHELAPQALYHGAFTALGLKHYDQALTHTREFVRLFPRSELTADVKYVAAESQLQLKDYPAAAALYRELVERHGDAPEADTWKLRRGLVALLDKKYDEVVATLTPVVDQLQSAESRAEAQFLIGSSFFHAERYPQAAAALAASLKTQPKWRQADEALLLLARTQAKAGEAERAQANFSRLLREYSASRVIDETNYRLAELLDGQQDYQGAARAYHVVASQHPDSQYAPYALYGQGWAKFKMKDYADAASAFTSLLKDHAGHELAAQATLGRALARRQAGDAKGSIADLDAYLKSNPAQAQQSDALYERGLALVSLQDYAGAARTLENLLKNDEQYAGADKVLYEIGWALKSQEKPAEAALRFAQLAEKYPNSKLAAEAWFHVGEDHYDRKQFADAKKAYASAKAKDPGDELAEKARYKLGWANFQLKDYADACQQFQEQLTAFPRGVLAADATFMKAECLFRQEKYQEAWPAYQAALETKATTPTIEGLTLLHAGQTAAQLKAWEESVQVLSEVAQRQPQSPLLAEAFYELGWAKQNLGKIEEALADYEAAATKSREHVGARARFMRGELLFTQKKHDEASREFQRAMYGYGGDQAAAETKNWQAKSGYEAGRCAEVQINAARDAAAKQKHVADAKRFYSFVAEKHGGHALAAEAKKRLNVLSKVDKKR
jgi:cellulose synthase operon protein C